MDDTSKKAQGTHFCSCFSGFRTRHNNSLLFNIILKETLFTFPSSRIGLSSYAPMVVRFIFDLFSLCKFSSRWLRSSENSITDIHKSILKFYFIEFTMLLMTQTLFFSNRPKFPADRLKLHAKVRKVNNSLKIFKLQIKEREQVSKNDKRFNVGKMK